MEPTDGDMDVTDDPTVKVWDEKSMRPYWNYMIWIE
jgi:hypothetical protein